MKTSDVIQTLSNDLKNNKPDNPVSVQKYLLFWLSSAIVLIIAAIYVLPWRDDLNDRLQQFEFWGLASLWAASAIIPAIIAYLSIFPARLDSYRLLKKIAFVPFAMIIAYAIYEFPTQNLSHAWYRERHFYNGGCGAVIFAVGLIHALFLGAWLRRGASTHPIQTGALAAFSTGAFTSAIVLFACPNENSIHVFLWHVLPLLGLTVLGSVLSRKLLRW